MLASADVDRQPSITVGILGAAALVAIFFAGVLVGPSLIGNAAWLWHRLPAGAMTRDTQHP